MSRMQVIDHSVKRKVTVAGGDVTSRVSFANLSEPPLIFEPIPMIIVELENNIHGVCSRETSLQAYCRCGVIIIAIFATLRDCEEDIKPLDLDSGRQVFLPNAWCWCSFGPQM